jgi:hypothetical protein
LNLNPKDIIFPEKYDGRPDTGYDIAFIGIDEHYHLALEKYFNELNSYNIQKKPYFETNDLNSFI